MSTTAPIELPRSSGCRDRVEIPAAPHQAERRTRAVVLLTAGMMVAELVVGFLTNSLALTADGFHMATHAGALALAAFAYWFARTRQHAQHFSFGTGKVYALAGYSNAIVLGIVALWMLVEAARRLIHPEPVAYAESIPVAVIGLVINLVSAKLLHPGGAHAHDHAHDHDHHDHDHHHHDHNLRAAYMHVLADALTSVLAIAALVGGWWLGWRFLDPLVGVIGGVVILKWGVSLCAESARQLLDAVPSVRLENAIRHAIEREADVEILDLHVWELGPGRCGCVVALSAANPRDTDHYRKLILGAARVAHLTVEVHRSAAA